MATYDASVKKALTASQQDLIDHKEHCSADPGRESGHQVRIKRLAHGIVNTKCPIDVVVIGKRFCEGLGLCTGLYGPALVRLFSHFRAQRSSPGLGKAYGFYAWKQWVFEYA